MTATRSEIAFERFLATNRVAFRRIPTVAETPTPDYAVTVGDSEITFEVKEITTHAAWASEVVHGHTVGEHIRRQINAAKRQIRTASNEGKPTILLIFNAWDPLQLSGTENHDFEHAMYGEHTVVLDIESRKIVDAYHGQRKSFQRSKNTSFSALARLREHGGPDASITLTLFENIHARVPLDYEALPACFEVVRVTR